MDKFELWSHAKPYIIKDINSEVLYNTYLKDAIVVSFENNIFTLAVSLPTKKNMIIIKYKKVIEDCLSKITGQKISLNVIINSSNQTPLSSHTDVDKPLKSEENKEQIIHKINNSNLNEKYTLENFVVGKSNSYAFAAAENVVNFPAQNNNPLFIYGKSGLGKTHLMQAIGNEILKKNPNMNVLYVTSEKFTNDMITFMKEKNMEEFKRHYRNVDVLLVDDVQFIEGKDATQEEFFYTFNDLHMKNKQIVLTSDRKPKELITLAERLRTRFEWGLTIDISLPDYETRVAILKKKAESFNIDVDDEILDYIAQRINSNVRELEGALSTVISYAGISHKEIDIDLAEYALASIIPDEIKLTPQAIIEAVSEFYNISVEDIKGASRQKELVLPRHVAMYLCKTLTDMNFGTIAKVFSNRDRTTVMHGVDRIMKNIQSDSNLKGEIDFITKDLLPN